MSGDLIVWVGIRLDVSVKERTKSDEVVLQLWRCCGSATLCVFYVHVCLCAFFWCHVTLYFWARFDTPPYSKSGVVLEYCWLANATCSKVIVVHDLVA